MTTEVKERTVAETREVVGQSVLPKDGLPKACGAPLYLGDLEFGNLLYGACLFAPVPSARILRIDTSKAAAIEGVRAVITARDLPAARYFGTAVVDQPVLCSDRIYCSADALAAVAAESLEIARRAVELIEVEYEELPGVFDPVKALDDGSPIAYPNHPKALQGNLLAHIKIRRGEPIEAAFARADVVVEQSYSTQFVDHAPMETETAVAVPNPDGSMTLFAQHQAPFILRRAIAPVFGLSIRQVQVIVGRLGGSFGGKQEVSIAMLARAGVLARKTGRPVVMQNTRRESFVSRPKRAPAVMRYKLGATREGKLVAGKIEFFLDKGPYATIGGTQPPPPNGIVVKMAVHATGPYEIPNVHLDAFNILTNNPATAQMRGLGVPQVHFAAESAMDELAAALGMSPLRLRLLNGFKVGSTTATGQVLGESVGLTECLQRAAEEIGWGRRRPEPSGPKRKGIGIGASWYCTGVGMPNDAAGGNIYMAEDGTVNVGIATIEIGQGNHTVLAQIVAEELGVRYEDVTVTRVDTSAMPDAGFTAGSRATFVPGNALVRAARQVKQVLIETAAGLLNAPPERLAIRSRRVYVVDAPDTWLPVAEVALMAWRLGRPLCGQGWWSMPPKSFDPETGQGVPWPVYSYGVQIAEVEVDTETGEVTLQRMVAAQDAGRAINPTSTAAQIEGGVVMGQGMALSEDCRVEGGRILNTDFMTYILPTTLDAPDITSILVEAPTELGPFGAKGIGEATAVPTAPAIANAIADAIGTRVRDLPITPEKVLKAIAEAESGAAASSTFNFTLPLA